MFIILGKFIKKYPIMLDTIPSYIKNTIPDIEHITKSDEYGLFLNKKGAYLIAPFFI